MLLMLVVLHLMLVLLSIAGWVRLRRRRRVGLGGFCPHAAGTGTGIDAGRGMDTDRGSWHGVWREEEATAVCRRRLGLGAVAVAEAGRALGS